MTDYNIVNCTFPIMLGMFCGLVILVSYDFFKRKSFILTIFFTIFIAIFMLADNNFYNYWLQLFINLVGFIVGSIIGFFIYTSLDIQHSVIKAYRETLK
jgi:hypothetical protein